MVKEEILHHLQQMEQENYIKRNTLKKRSSLLAYHHLVYTGISEGSAVEIWTNALQTALLENEIVEIPAQNVVYYLDNTVVIPSNRHILAADNAVISLTDTTTVLMLRNEHTKDGTHAPFSTQCQDENISISGGVWRESRTSRMGYGTTGMYDKNRSFYGVSTCMFFNNIQHLTLTNLTFLNTAGFSVQVGNLKNAVFTHIKFQSCFADGLHINGNTENLLIKDISGQVGDDLVALNMYDWQDSSVNFGPLKCAWVEGLCLSEDSRYKALRIEPGTYIYDDNSFVDCGIFDVVIKNVVGIHTFKLYYQTPKYAIGTAPEPGDVGSGDNVYFEDITIDLTEPVDALPDYVNHNPVRGAFAAFEIGANIKNLSLENIDFTLHRDKFPLSNCVIVGPKSCKLGEKEVFDPYVVCTVDHLTLKHITINGETPESLKAYIKTTSFTDINQDGNSTGCGKIINFTYEK